MKRDATVHSQARKAWREHKRLRRDKAKSYSSERLIGWRNREWVKAQRKYNEVLAWSDNQAA
jgi:hypothetical protein